MRVIFLFLLSSFISTISNAQTIHQYDIQTVAPLLQKEAFREAYERTSQLLATAPKDTSELKAQVAYMNIYAAAGMVAADQMTHSEFQTQASKFIGQRLVTPAQPCVDAGENPLNTFHFNESEKGLQGSSCVTNKNNRILILGRFQYINSINPSEHIGNDVRNSGILEAIEINPKPNEIWIARLRFGSAFIKISQAKSSESKIPSTASTGFSNSPASFTIYKAGNGKLFTQSQVDSIVVEKNKRFIGARTEIQVTGRQVERDTAFLSFSFMTQIVGEELVDSAGLANREKLKTVVNKPLPQFEFFDINGKLIKSKDLKGKPIVINFWFTTCPPCIKEMPELNRIQAEYKNTDVVFLSMTYETKEKVEQFLKKRAFTYRAIADAKPYINQFTDLYPVTIFVNRQGIVTNFTGGLPTNEEKTGETMVSTVDSREFLKHLGEIAQGKSF